MGTRRLVAVVVLAVLACMAGQRLASGQVLDRLLATVDRQVITLSDVRAALELGLVDARDEAGALDALVVRALVLAEVARYAPPEPGPGEVETSLDRIRERLGPDGLQAAMRRSGLGPDHLRVLIAQDLLIQSYLAQRFSVTAVPTDEQVEEYYQARRDTFVDAAGRPLDAATARPVARERLTAERRARFVDEWIADLRRRAQVRVRPLLP